MVVSPSTNTGTYTHIVFLKRGCGGFRTLEWAVKLVPGVDQ